MPLGQCGRREIEGRPRMRNSPSLGRKTYSSTICFLGPRLYKAASPISFRDFIDSLVPHQGREYFLFPFPFLAIFWQPLYASCVFGMHFIALLMHLLFIYIHIKLIWALVLACRSKWRINKP